MRYSIPECNMESLQKKLTRIRNKCVKYGCEFKFDQIGEHFEEVTVNDEIDELGRILSSHKETVKYIDVDVDGVAVVNGWRFVASLEYTENGNIISGVGDVEVPEKYYSCGPWCEHCKTSRDRKYSYIVYKGETGEFKQVGKSCLRDFTGGLSAEMAAMVESFFKECDTASEFTGFGSFGTRWYRVDEYAKYVAETIRIYGFVRKDGVGMSTADRAFNMMLEDMGRHNKWFEEDYDDAKKRGFDVDNKKSVEFAKNVLEWAVNNEKDNNYFHNLKVVCGLEYCKGWNTGLIASAFPAYDRELEYEAIKREREEQARREGMMSKWVGNVGDKISFVITEVRTITSWENQWGYTYVYKIVDNDNNVYTWKTSNYLDDHDVGRKVKATVKDHKEYRDVKQTEITRARVGEKVVVSEEKHEPWDDSALKAFDDFVEYCEIGA